MKFTISREEEFIPTWRDNDKSDSPIKFILKNLSVTERDGLLNVAFDSEGKPNTKTDFPKACRIGIKSIENLIVNEIPIEKASQFLDLPGEFHDLMMNVATKILTMNAIRDQEAQKNS